MSNLDRRRFLRRSASLAAGAALISQAACDSAGDADDFASAWQSAPDRVWIGPQYWANPLQDWRLAAGRVECHFPSPDRHLHLLTHSVRLGLGELEMSVKTGRIDAALGAGAGSVGFRLGNRGKLDDYRNALVHGNGLDVGLTASGGLFIGDPASATPGAVDIDRDSVELRLLAKAAADVVSVTLMAHDPDSGAMLAEVSRGDLSPGVLAGGVALLANAPAAGAAAPNQTESAEAGRFWFSDWTVSGDLVERHDDRAFGPVLFVHYTLSRGVMKMTAQMPPVGPDDAQQVRLEIQQGGQWSEAATAPIDATARTATLRVENWDASADTPYRVLYALADGSGTSDHAFEGTVRRDPVDQPVVTIADISCNAHYAFPNNECVASVAKLNPDLFCFTGDQYYESTGGYGALRFVWDDRATLDMLRKWYQHGWTWRDLIRDRPAVSIPDDHDVFHGNLWGEGGELCEQGETLESGGYVMAPEFVNAVHRTQTAHHPDPPDPAPCKRGISVYFGDMLYGGVSWAILADRQFKTAPEGHAPSTGGRADHVTDPNFNPKTADKPGFDLLGERQMKFLADWAEDWEGAEMKGVISQTIFTAMATHHGGNHMRLIADYDTNAWPQTARNAAVRLLRKALAFHLAGDQHLPAVVQYGVDAPGDGPVAFASPAVNNLYPRWFEPAGADQVTGDFKDSFGHPMRVLACANPKTEFRKDPLEREMDAAAGFGVARFDKTKREVTVECWPLLADPTQAGAQFPGWPVTVSQGDSFGARVAGYLPPIEGAGRPVVQVIAESSGETLYNVRAPAPGWRPFVFQPGAYTVRLIDLKTGRRSEFVGLEPDIIV